MVLLIIIISVQYVMANDVKLLTSPPFLLLLFYFDYSVISTQKLSKGDALTFHQY